MKSKRAFLFRALTILVLLLIGGVMLIIGRGHSVYLDNKTLEYEGNTYEGPYKIEVFVDDESVGKLYKQDRGMASCMGQKFEMLLEITQEKGGEETLSSVMMQLPYDMDGIIINLPGLLAGLPSSAYLSEFVPVVAEESDETAEEELVTDEFALTTEEP